MAAASGPIDVPEEARAAARAQDLRQQVDCELVVAADALGVPAVHRVALLQVAVRAAETELGLRRLARSGLLRIAVVGELAVGGHDRLLDLGRADVAGDDEDHVAWHVEGAEEVEQVLAFDIAQDLVGSDPPALDPVLREGGREHPLQRQRRRVVELAVRLLDHDLRFALELLGVEERVGDRVGHDLEGSREPLGRHDEVVVGRVVDRAGVGVAADGRELLADLFRAGKLLRALEEHVLEQVRHAGDLVRLVEVARLHPGVDRDHPGSRLLPNQEREAVREGRLRDAREKGVERPGRRSGAIAAGAWARPARAETRRRGRRFMRRKLLEPARPDL